MIWRLFSKSRPASSTTAWWASAAALASSPDARSIDALERDAVAIADDPDEHERQVEMIDGLRALLDVSDGALPTVHTQHRVVGEDSCHFLAPASLVHRTDAAGKIFLTSRRIVFVGGAPAAWPWHRVLQVTRVERDVLIQLLGHDDVVGVRCNTYGDALVAAHLAERLARAARAR